MARLCVACGSATCPGLAGIDYCPRWQEAEVRRARGEYLTIHPLTPSADLPACRDEDPAWTAAAHPDPPEYAHPEDDDEPSH